MEDPKKRDWFNVLDKNGRREITMAEQMTWDVLGAKEMVNIDLIHAETNEDGNSRLTSLRNNRPG